MEGIGKMRNEEIHNLFILIREIPILPWTVKTYYTSKVPLRAQRHTKLVKSMKPGLVIPAVFCIYQAGC